MSSNLSKTTSVSEHSNKASLKVFDRLSRAAKKSDAPTDPSASSSLKSPRLSVDRSHHLNSKLNSKPTIVDRRLPKVSTPPDKQQARVLRGSELQAQLSVVQEDLKNTKEKLVLIEKEKAQAIEGLKEAQKSADEANEKLKEAKAAQKTAEGNSENEKFRAVEMEQAAIESTRKKKEDWEKELEAVRNQHAIDLSALLLAKEEIQKIKQDLTTNLNAKNEAVIHVNKLDLEIGNLKQELEREKRNEQKLAEAEARVEELIVELETAKLDESNACKLTEERENKIKNLEAKDSESSELVSKLDIEIQALKQKLDKAKNYEEKLVEKEVCIEKLNAELEAAKLAESYAGQLTEEWKTKIKNLEARDSESAQLMSELDIEIQTLKQKLENAKSYEHKLVENEACIEKLNVELEATKLSELYARKSLEEWRKKVKDLESRAKESNRLERSASESMESVLKQLEGNNDLLHEAESEIVSLKEKVGLLQISIARQRGELEEAERQLSMAKEKAAEMKKKAEILEYELENVEDEKTQALENEKLAAESVQTLLKEKNKFINELEILRDEEQRNKKAMESLAKDLHEVSIQAREAKERLSSSQTEQENYEDQIENLRLVLNATNDKYKSMLDEAKHEIDVLTDTIEQNKQEYQNLRNEWEQKEADMMNFGKKSEDENNSLRKEISKLTELLKEVEEEAGLIKEEGNRLKISLKEAEIEESYLKDIIGQTKAESMKLKESLLEKENEMLSVVEENDIIQSREVAYIEKIEELQKMIDQIMKQKQEAMMVVNGELSEKEKDCDVPLKVVECYEQNGNGREEEMPKVEENLTIDDILLSDEDVDVDEVEIKNFDGDQKDYENKKKEEETEEVDVKKWEILENEEKELVHEDLDSKVDESENFEQVNGLSSTEMVENGGTSRLKQHQKKKKPLLQKFGSLLKKKGTVNQK